jgi:AAA-like domain
VNDFVTAGAVPADSTAYVQRPFEDTCFAELAAGRWVVLLGPRQHGKTSALVRLRERLIEEGFDVAVVDMQRYAGEEEADYSSFLRWFILRIVASPRRDLVRPSEDSSDDLEGWLESNLHDWAGTLAILVDEATGVPVRFRPRFFGQLRALYNSRATALPDAIARRVMLLFAGTFRPERVIDGDNSPFNVSTTVYTDDLTPEQATQLAIDAGSDGLATWVEKAYELIGGQPYLLQKLLDAVSSGEEESERQLLFDNAVGDLRSGRDRHVPALLDRLAAEPGATELVAQIAESADGIRHAATGLHAFLPVVGIARHDGDRLVVRNELYRELALSSPQITPSGPRHTTAVPLAHQPTQRFAVLVDPVLRQLAEDGYAAGVDAANRGHTRAALVAFGSAYEAILLDFLIQLPKAERDNASSVVMGRAGRPVGGSPTRWKFETMIDVAHQTGKLPHLKP